MKDTSPSLIMLEAHIPEAYSPADPVYRGLSMREMIRHFSIRGGTLVSPPAEKKSANPLELVETHTDANENADDGCTVENGYSVSEPLPCTGSRMEFRRHSLDDNFLFQSTKHGLSVSPSDLLEQPLKKRSKKKLRFADEEGGSLEEIKLFTKEKAELEQELSHLTSLSMLLRSELDLDRDEFGLFEDDLGDEDIQYYDDVFLYDDEEEEELHSNSPSSDNQYSPKHSPCNLWAMRNTKLATVQETVSNADDNNNANEPRVEVQRRLSGDSFTPRQFSCALPDQARRLTVLNTQNVVLDSVNFEDSKFHGSILVQNFDSQNSVRVRATFNDWDDFVDIDATVREADSSDSEDSESGCSSSDGDVEMAPRSSTATFDFEVLIPSEVEKDIQFAVCYEMDGRPFWDTNDGDNYIAIPC